MLLGETDPDARHVGPLHAVDGDGNPVLGEDFSGAGELEIKVADGAFAAALGTIVETGSGYYYYLATAADALVGPWIEIKIAGVCQEFTLREDVAAQLGGIIAGETDPDLLVIGSLRFIDADGNPLGAADIAAATKEVSINGAALGAPAGTFSCVEDGYLDYIADPTEVTARGWVAVRISGTCQEIMFREDVVDPLDSDEPTTEAVTPIGEIDADDEIVIDVADDVELSYIAAFATLSGSLQKIAIFRRGAFEPGFTLGSYVEEIPEDEGVRSRLHIKPDGPWPPGNVSITVDPVDSHGNLGD